MTQFANALPNGTQVDEFIIDSVLGGGGFSIVYRAHHKDSKDTVVIKEYMPQKLARRVANNHIASINQNEPETFNKGKKLFFQEANSLGMLNHPNIVNVITFFPANNTNYMVMEEVKGVNLQSYIKKYEGNLSEKLLRIILPELVSGIRAIHEQKLLHLDIKPGNIHLRAGGIPLLLDFGAVRESHGSRLYDCRVVATAGFAPIEQVTDRGYLGPWTDIYAIGATIRSCIEGKAPPPSAERKDNDPMKPAIKAFKNRYSEEFLKIIDWAMEFDPEIRPQSCDQLLEEINKLPPLKDKPQEKPGLFKKLAQTFKKK